MGAEPTPAARPFLSAVVLAAGASRRMGRPKPLLPLAGRPLLQHALTAAAASSLDEIVLVLGHRAAEVRAAIALPERARVVEAPDWRAGASASLAAGLRAAAPAAAAAAVLLGDQPGVTAARIDAVAAAFLASDAPAARPVYGPRRVPGHPVFLARSLWPRLEALRGDAGARRLLEAHPDWLFELPIDDEPPADLDTWLDYRRACGRASHPREGADG